MEPPVNPKRKPVFGDFKITDSDKKLLDKMPSKFRSALLATGTMAEIASAFGVAEGTAKSRIHRAKAMLMEMRKNAAGASCPG